MSVLTLVINKTDTPYALLLEPEQQHLVRTAIDCLDEHSRKIITMLFLRETPASYTEVAVEIGVSETSFSPLRKRCLKSC